MEQVWVLSSLDGYESAATRLSLDIFGTWKGDSLGITDIWAAID